MTENGQKVAEKLDKVAEKAATYGEPLTGNRMAILQMMIENPYVTREELSKGVGISTTSVYRNIEAMRGKYVRRIGLDKGGFWEIII